MYLKLVRISKFTRTLDNIITWCGFAAVRVLPRYQVYNAPVTVIKLRRLKFLKKITNKTVPQLYKRSPNSLLSRTKSPIPDISAYKHKESNCNHNQANPLSA